MRMIHVAPAMVMLGLSAVVFVGTRELPYWTDFTPGPAFLPRWIAGAGVFLSVILLVQARRTSGGKLEWPEKPSAIRVALTTIGLILCVPLAPYVGFIAVSFLFMFGMLVGILRRKLVPSLLTAAFTGVLLFTVFKWWLKVALPAGPLGF